MASGSSEPPDLVAALPASFDDLYRREYPQLVRSLLVLTGRRDVAEELVQDAFAAAHRRWTTVGSFERPDAWVRRVALNAAVSSARRRTTEAQLIFRMGRERRAEETWTPETADIWRAIRRLPARQAQVAVLVMVEDRAIAEVALILECTEDTVRTHLRRGRAALARQLAVDSEGEDHE